MDEGRIKPVIDIRNMWRDGEPTRLLSGRENVVYDFKGTVSCVCPETGKQREMCILIARRKKGKARWVTNDEVNEFEWASADVPFVLKLRFQDQ